MKVGLVSSAISGGGAALACLRLADALVISEVEPLMFTCDRSHRPAVTNPSVPKVDLARPLGFLERAVLKLQYTPNRVHHSLGLLGAGLARAVAESDVSLVNLHWINGACLSLSDVRMLATQRPVVWTLHDMWVFLGAEHYLGSYDDHRFESGYSAGNRLSTEGGLNLNAWVWDRKMRLLPESIVYLTPSRWLADQARRSALLRDRRVEVIPNAIDTEFWSPGNQKEEKARLGIAADEKVLLFSAAAGFREWRKGEDLLEEALAQVGEQYPGKIAAVTIGGAGIAGRQSRRFRRVATGFISKADEMRAWYRAADLVLVPSRMDNFPNVAIEAMACGIPCCGFDSGGISEAVQSGSSGVIVEREDVASFAAAIIDLLSDDACRAHMGAAARVRAEREYGLRVIGDKHRTLYEDVIRLRTKTSSG